MPRLAALGSLLLLLLLLGCATPEKRFQAALDLEKREKFAAALAEYQALLPRVSILDRTRRSQLHLRIGECLWQLERPNEALRELEQAIALDSGNLPAQLRVGELYLAAGALDRAAEHATFVVAQDATNVEGLTLLGAVYAAAGQRNLAAEFLGRALQRDPARVQVSLSLADIYNFAGETAKAREVLERSAVAAPQSSIPRIALGRLAEQEGDNPTAEEYYRAAVAAEDTPDSNLHLAEFLQRRARIGESELVLRRIEARHPSAATLLADFEVASGRAGSAVRRYEQALRSGALPEGLPRGVVVSRLVEADLVLAAKGSDAALRQARAHLDQFRKELDAVTVDILESEIALVAGQLPTARLRAEAAVSRAPQSAAAHYALGSVLFRSGDAATARAEWAAALEHEPRFLPARLALTRSLLRAGDLGQAEHNAAFAVRQEPANLDALTTYARVLLARKRFEAAHVIAVRAQAVDAAAAEPRILLGDVALAQDRPGSALIHYQQAVILEPRSQAAIDGLTRVYRTGKVDRQMLRKMEELAAREPRSSTLLELVGRLYADNGLVDDAARALNTALQAQRDRVSAASALARLYAAEGRMGDAASAAAHTGDDSAALLEAVRAEQRNDLPAAIRSYESAVRRGERTGVAANNLAWLYAQEGTNLDRALALARSARQLAPENAAFLDTLGYVHLQRREYTDAIEALKNALSLAARSAPPSSETLLARFRGHLRQAYLLSGQPDQAAALDGN